MRSLEARREPPKDAGVANESSEEEGEIKDDHPGSSEQQGEIRDDRPLGAKRKRSPSNEGSQAPKKTTGPKQTIESFTAMLFPYERLPCMISVNEQGPIGSLYKSSEDFAILFFIDPGRFTAPIVTLSFRKSGTESGPDFASNAWDMESIMTGQWAMTDVVTGYGIVNGADVRMSNELVLAACSDKDKSNLMYMRFKSWPHVRGFYEKGAFKDLSLAIKHSMASMFGKLGSYQLEIWFIAPFNATMFRRHCLRYFTDSLAHRQRPLDQWQDLNGRYFNEISKLPPPAFLVGGKPGKTLRMPSAAKKSRSLPRTTTSRIQQVDATQDTAAARGNTSNQAEQSSTLEL